MICMFMKRGEYAHKAVITLALLGKERMRISDLAQRESIPAPFLGKLIGDLKRKGIVQTRTGRHGGVALAADPSQVSLWDIVSAVEKEPVISSCPFPAGDCSYRTACAVSARWKTLMGEMIDLARSTTLAELVEMRGGALPPPIGP